MTQAESRAAEALIDWAVAPAPPLPQVAATGAVAAFARSLDQGPRSQRMALRALLAAIALLSVTTRDRGAGPLQRLYADLPAGIGEAVAGLAQLAYYGEPAVLTALDYRPSALST